MRSPLPALVGLTISFLLACGGSTPAGGVGNDRVWVEPATLSFGAVPAGERAEATVLLRAEGRVPVRVRSIAVVTETAGVELLDRPETVPPGGVALRVGYRPTAPGPLVGTVVLELASRTTPRLEIPLEGGCPGSSIDCTPTTLDFGAVPIGTDRTATFVCTHSGWAPPRTGYVAVGAVIDSSILAIDPSGRDLAPGESVEFTVRYSPLDFTPLELTLDVVTDPPRAAPAIALHGAGVPSRCQLQFEAPDELVAPPGGRVNAELVIRNVGAAPCWIPSASLRGCEDFEALEAIGNLAIDPGATWAYPIQYRPRQLGPDTCEVTFAVEPPARATVAGEGTYRGCLELPGGTAVVPAGLWTCPTQRAIEIGNRCEVSVPVSISLENDGPAAFALAEAPGALAPNGRTPIPLVFTPPAGATYRALVRVEDPEGNGGAVPVTGTGTEPEALTFTAGFFIPRDPPDALVVVDNGVSMSGLADRVRADLGRLYDALDRGNEGRWAEHHVAVTTTALAPDPSCPNGVQGGEDGRFVPVDGRRPRAIAWDTTNRRWTLEENLTVGSCHHAAAQPLEAALRALTPPLSTLADDPRHPEPNDGNLGLLDASASRLLVLVTNRDDASPLAVSEYAARLAEAGVAEVLAIAGAPPTGCTRGAVSALPAERLAAFVEAFPESQFASICELPLRTTTLPPRIEERCFACAPDTNLDGRVDDADVRVLVNGVAVSAAEGGWTVDAETRALCLGEGAELYWGENTVSLVWP